MKMSFLSLFLILFVTPVLLSQVTPSQIKYLTEYRWKVRVMEIRNKDGETVKTYQKEEMGDCLATAIHQYKADGTLLLHLDKTICGEDLMKGNWAFKNNFSQIEIDMDGYEAVTYEIAAINSTSIEMRRPQRMARYGGEVWEYTLLQLAGTENKEQQVVAEEKKNVVPSRFSESFCKELDYILSSLRERELEKIVDYNKPRGITRSWYDAKVPLSGVSSLAGQNMMGYLTFSGFLSNSDTPDNQKLYQSFVTQIEACLGSSFNKKVEEKKTKFIHKTTEGLVLAVEYWGEGRSIEIVITRTSS